MNLKCALCTDRAITAGATAPDSLPDAITLAPVVQEFSIGGQQIAAPLMVPVCYGCREQQLGRVSKTGLVLS